MNWKKRRGGGAGRPGVVHRTGIFFSQRKNWNCQAHFLFLALTAALAHCKNKTRTQSLCFQHFGKQNALYVCRVSLCVAFGRLEFFSLIICLFVSSDACVLKKRHERRDCRPWVLSYFFFRLCLFSFGWAFNIITKLMLCCFGSCAVFPYLACSRNSALFFSLHFFFMISHRMIATHIHNDIYVCTRLYKHSRRPGPLRSFPPPHFPRSPLSL